MSVDYGYVTRSFLSQKALPAECRRPKTSHAVSGMADAPYRLNSHSTTPSCTSGETYVPHPAMSPNNVAVVTGGASGIGLAAAMRFARLGMKVCIADLSGKRLTEAEA